MERNDLIEKLDGEIAAVMWKSPLGVDRVALKDGHKELTCEPEALWPLTSVTYLLATIARLSKALEEAEKKGAEAERLRFEGDLDKWMKALGAGITGYQPEAYAVMDAACAELVKLRTEVETLRDPWSSDMSAMPRRQDVWVYQPASKTGRSTLPARICELRNAGYIRESTHWMLPAPPRDISQGGQHG